MRIGVAKEKGGLYCFVGKASYPSRDQMLVACSSQTIIDHHNIWLHHYRLGHTPFTLLKVLFPTLFHRIDPNILHCNVCILSKQHRVPYPRSNKISSKPFALIHYDVWGPYLLAKTPMSFEYNHQ